MSFPELPFWRRKSLEQMNAQEWESLCDGCGRCCLIKLEDADDGTLYHTDVACRLFDATSCRCSDYANRSAKVPDCVTLTPHEVLTLRWLPPTCAYRLVSEGQDLDWWHPLVSGTGDTVVEAGVSVKGRVSGNEDAVSLAKLQSRIRQWPNRTPKNAFYPPKNQNP
ncbi:MAG: YcgN family cysteine cluster protein [Beijerinckiaceae bacterium]